MRMTFEQNNFGKRLKSMLKVDFRRMFTMPLLYIMVGVCLVMPILILVMTTMMDGSVSVDPTTGVETIIEGFDNTWQIIGSVSGENSMMSMGMIGMCNINMVYFCVAVLVCIFVADDFRSGYAKNLFTVRAKKTDYVISKTLVGFVGGVLMILAFFVGAMLGGTIAGLPFELGSASAASVVMCMLSKLILVLAFAAIFVMFGVAGKQKLPMSLTLSLFAGMLFFMMVPMLTPLDATIMNVILCLAGSVVFSAGFGAVSSKILGKTSLV